MQTFNHGYRLATSTQTGKEYYPRQDIQESTVYDLVYRYLSKIADKDRTWRQRNSACNKFHREHARKKNIHEQSLTTIWGDFHEEIGDNNESKSCTDKNIPKPFKMSRISSEECIANYMKAVRDGRRRAKFYLRDALLYGLRSRLLTPINKHRNVLRVSQKLRMFH